MSRSDRPALLLQARAGQALAIVLDAQPGAGLLWQALPPPPGCSLVADGQASAGAGDGSAVQQRFLFTAAAPGVQMLRFVLQRSWDDQPMAVQPVQVTVQ